MFPEDIVIRLKSTRFSGDCRITCVLYISIRYVADCSVMCCCEYWQPAGDMSHARMVFERCVGNSSVHTPGGAASARRRAAAEIQHENMFASSAVKLCLRRLSPHLFTSQRYQPTFVSNAEILDSWLRWSTSHLWLTRQSGNLVSTFLVTCGMNWIVIALVMVSVPQIYTSAALHPLTTANVEQCHI